MSKDNVVRSFLSSRSRMWSIEAMPRVSDMGEQSEITMVKGGRRVLRVRRLRRSGGAGHRLGLSEASLWVGEAGVGFLGTPAVSGKLPGQLRIRVCGFGRSRDA